MLLLFVLLAALAAGQTHRWEYRYNGPHGLGVGDAANCMVETSNGNVLLCGTGVSNGVQCALLVEVSQSGTETWVGVLDSVIPYAVCRGTGGRVVVAGKRIAGTDKEHDLFYDDATIVCVTVGGSEAWRYDYDFPDPASIEEVLRVIQAPNGNVYAIGRADNTLCLWALDGATGGLLDRAEMTGPGGVNLQARDVCCSQSSEVYCSSTYLTSGQFNVLVEKYQAGGGGWATIYDGYGFDDDAPRLAASPGGGVVLAGATKTSNSTTKLLVANLNPLSGNREWTYEYSFDNRTDYAYDLAFDGVGNIYVAGASIGPSGNRDFLVLSLTNGGQERWIDRYIGPTGDDYGMAVDVGGDGNIYAIGNSQSANWNWDFCAVSLTPAGQRRWVHRYDAGRAEWVNLYCGYYGMDGNVYIGGSGDDGAGSTQMLLESVDPATGIAERGDVAARRPAGATVCRGSLRLERPAELFAGDGRRAASLVAGTNRLDELAPGAYVLRDAAGVRLLRLVR
jgi:hypothetical protein